MNDRNFYSPTSVRRHAPPRSARGAAPSSMRSLSKVDGPLGIGARLKHERELRGMSVEEIARATRIISAAIGADWAPISEDGVLHDRASYRYFWQLLERAHQTGRALPQQAQAWFANPDSPQV